MGNHGAGEPVRAPHFDRALNEIVSHSPSRFSALMLLKLLQERLQLALQMPELQSKKLIGVDGAKNKLLGYAGGLEYLLLLLAQPREGTIELWLLAIEHPSAALLGELMSLIDRHLAVRRDLPENGYDLPEKYRMNSWTQQRYYKRFQEMEDEIGQLKKKIEKVNSSKIVQPCLEKIERLDERIKHLSFRKFLCQCTGELIRHTDAQIKGLDAQLRHVKLSAANRARVKQEKKRLSQKIKSPYDDVKHNKKVGLSRSTSREM